MHQITRTPTLTLAEIPPLRNAAPAFAPSPGFENPILTAAFLVSGTVVVVLLLTYFLKHDRYARPPEPERGVAFAVAREDARARISALAPRVMLVARMEEALSCFLAQRSTTDDACREAKKLLSEAVPPGLWEKFVEASSLAERDPEQAHKNLDALSPAVETALRRLVSAEELLLRVPEDEGDP